MAKSADFVAFAKRMWNPRAFVQSSVLAIIAIILTNMLKSFRSFEWADATLPAGVFGYVYWRNGVLNQSLAEADKEEEDQFDRRAPRLGGRSVEYVRGSAPQPGGISVVMVFATWCKHSRASFSPFVSAAMKFKSAKTPPSFVALTRCEADKAKQFLSDLGKQDAQGKPIQNISAIAVASDKAGVVDALQKVRRGGGGGEASTKERYK